LTGIAANIAFDIALKRIELPAKRAISHLVYQKLPLLVIKQIKYIAQN